MAQVYLQVAFTRPQVPPPGKVTCTVQVDEVKVPASWQPVIVWSPVSVKRVTVTVDAVPMGIWVAPMTTATATAGVDFNVGKLERVSVDGNAVDARHLNRGLACCGQKQLVRGRPTGVTVDCAREGVRVGLEPHRPWPTAGPYNRWGTHAPPLAVSVPEPEIVFDTSRIPPPLPPPALIPGYSPPQIPRWSSSFHLP